MEKLKFKAKYIPMILVILVLSVVSAISVSVYDFARQTHNYEIHITKDSQIETVLIANSPIQISRLDTGEEAHVKDNKVYSDVDEYAVIVTTSSVESLYLKVVGKGTAVYLDGQAQQIGEDGVYANYIGIIKMIKLSVSKITILYFVISLLVASGLVYLIHRFLEKIKKGEVKWYDIIILSVCLWIIYLFTFYFLYTLLHELVVAPMIGILIYVLYCIGKSKDKRFENIYASLVVFLGISIMFLVPPCNVPDEASHFARAYKDSLVGIQEGYGDYFDFPVAIDNLWYKFTNNLHMTGNKIYGAQYLSEIFANNDYTLNDTMTNYNNVRYQSFVPYMPTSVIIFIGRHVGASIFVLLMLGRLANFIIVSIICYFAIKRTPHFKKIFLVVCLFPIFIQQAAAINMDYLTNAICILLMSQILRMIYKEGKLQKNDYISLAIICFVFAVSKFGYFPLLLTFFLVPNDKFKSKKVAIITKCAFLTVTTILSYVVSSSLTKDSMVDPNVYGLKYFFTNPFGAAKIMLNAFFGRVDQDIIRGFIDCFAYSNVWHKGPLYLVIIVMYVLMILMHDDNDAKLKWYERVLYVLAFFMILGIVYAVAFTQWTKIGDRSISGVQARYFVAIAPVLYIGLSNKKVNVNTKNNKMLYATMICITFAISFVTLTMAFS